MMDLLNQFEAKLEVSKMQGQLRLLNFACAAKARTRSVTLTRPSRDETLEFRLVGGHQKATGGGIFVDFVGKGSSAAKKGLKRGDQILDVNGQNFSQVGWLDFSKFSKKQNFECLEFREMFIFCLSPVLV